MALPPPAPVIASGAEDLQNIETDIDLLFQQFITPIDAIRSISRPAISGGNSDLAGMFANITIDSTRLLESRCHAFYRYIGFPVVASDGSFYNAGFNSGTDQNIEAQQTINEKIASSALQTLMNVRETTPEETRDIFARQDISSSIYALVLKYPRPFQIFDVGKKAMDIDPQVFTVEDRNTEILSFAAFNPDLSDAVLGTSSAFSSNLVGPNFSGGRHILQPFIVDPRIETTTMPDKNRLCVPFLKDKNSTKLSANVYLSRPGIELIIRDRLSDKNPDINFLNNAKKILDGKVDSSISISDASRDSLDALIAISDDNDVSSPALLKDFQSLTSTQINQTTRLVKMIKVVIGQLFESMQVIDRAKSKINWVPLPSVDGPESGPKGAVLSRAGSNNVGSAIDNKIVELRIKKLNSERSSQERIDLGNFASPFSANIPGEGTQVYDQQLQEEIRKRDRIADNAFRAMSRIEKISGEVSGLGLIDVLAIYTALWAIDIGSLIAFLDEASFTRLINFNPSFKSLASSSRGTNILDALDTFGNTLTNIFTFCDKLLLLQTTDFQQEAGTI